MQMICEPLSWTNEAPRSKLQGILAKANKGRRFSRRIGKASEKQSGFLSLAVKPMAYITLALLWSLWCAVHSALVSMTATDYLRSRLGSHFRFYRLFYNGFAIVTLIPVTIYSYTVQGEPVFVWDGYLRVVQVFLFFLAIYLFFAGMTHYDALQFLGIRQVKQKNFSEGMTKTGRLNASGILGKIRHPWYVGSIVFIWARQLDVSAIIVNIILTAHLIIGTYLEERKLIAEFGDEYRAYQQEVPMFIPYKWLKSKMRGMKIWNKARR